MEIELPTIRKFSGLALVLLLAVSSAVIADDRRVEKGADFADGLTGGPDFWEVTGVPRGDTLSLRETPSPGGKLVIGVGNGEALKNGGCQNTRGQRWCRVSTKRGDQGWANGAYLREGAGWR